MNKSKYTKVAVIIMVILFVAISVLSCSTHVHTSNNSNNSSSNKKIPPGQAKKMSGSKSAKAYAWTTEKTIISKSLLKNHFRRLFHYSKKLIAY